MNTDFGNHDELREEANQTEEQEEALPASCPLHNSGKHINDGRHHHLHGDKLSREKIITELHFQTNTYDPPSVAWAAYFCVQTQEDEHDKEADGPELGQRHHGHRLRVCDECQAWTWKTKPK